MHQTFILTAVFSVLALADLPARDQTASVASGVSKAGDVVLYEDPKFYAAFPSMVRRPDGELLVAFRRAPERRGWGETGVSHTDPNSQLVLVRSRDQGRTWSGQPELIYAHPFGGAQDPCMIQLRQGTILCTSYAWALLAPEAFAKLTPPISRHGQFAFLGGFLLRSKDGAQTWEPPIAPPACPGELNRDVFGKIIPAYNRGALCEGRDGRLFWVVAASRTNAPGRTSTHLLISRNEGTSWEYSCPVAEDPKFSFNEASIYETPKGAWVAFIRKEQSDGHTIVARSTDGGNSFQWHDAGFVGYPHHALRLPDNRVLLTYGYRTAPFGIRARVLNSECTDAATAPEIILREDGGNGDLGYPWATMVTKDRALVVYYFNRLDGLRQIAGTFLEVK